MPITFFTTINAQTDTARVYHKSKTYNYLGYQDQDIVRLKTEKYIKLLIKKEFKVTKNQINENEIDIDYQMNILKFNVVYKFNESNFTVDLWFPKVYNPKKKEWIYIREENDYDKKLLELVENFSFKHYENEVFSNF